MCCVCFLSDRAGFLGAGVALAIGLYDPASGVVNLSEKCDKLTLRDFEREKEKEKQY